MPRAGALHVPHGAVHELERAPLLDEAKKRDILYDNAARSFRLDGAPPA